MKTTLSPRKSPRQARSQAMVEAILDTTARVLVERGYAGINTNLVAERAGVSVGSLYQYFPNKDALVTALHKRHVDRVGTVFGDAVARSGELGFDAALVAVTEALVESHRMEAGLHHALETQLSGHEDLDSHREAESAIAERLMELLQRYPDDVKVENLRLATFTLMHAMHGLVHAVVLERPAGVSLKAATAEIVRMARGYLKGAA